MVKLLLLFMLIFGLVACGGGDEQSQTNNTTNNNQSASQTAVVITKDNFGQLAKAKEVIILPSDAIIPTGVALSPDGTLAAVSYPAGVALVTLADSNIRTLSGHEGQVNDVAFSPDGTLLATASNDKTVKIWNVGSGEVVTTITQDKNMKRVVFSPDGSQLAVGSDWDVVYVFNVESGEQVAEYMTPIMTNISSVAFTPDGASLVVGAGDGSVRIVSVADATVTAEMSIIGGEVTMGGISSANVSADGTQVIASNSASGGLFLFDATTGERLAEQKVQYIHNSVVYHPDGAFFIGNWTFGGGKIAAYDPATLEKIGTEIENVGAFGDIAFSADGTTIATATMSLGQTVLAIWRVNG